jgi:hypothetical protein
MPKPITQAEIVGVLRNYEASMVAALEIRRRLEEDATVEPGRYSLESDGDKEPISGLVSDMSSGLIAWGLEIYEPDEQPDWAKEDVPSGEYLLTVQLTDSSMEPCIEMTKTEFVELRSHLARMRRLPSPAKVA